MTAQAVGSGAQLETQDKNSKRVAAKTPAALDQNQVSNEQSPGAVSEDDDVQMSGDDQVLRLDQDVALPKGNCKFDPDCLFSDHHVDDLREAARRRKNGEHIKRPNYPAFDGLHFKFGRESEHHLQRPRQEDHNCGSCVRGNARGQADTLAGADSRLAQLCQAVV
jgi:hypothetical protein